MLLDSLTMINYYNTFRAEESRSIIIGTRLADRHKYCNNTPRSEQRQRRPRGTRGLSRKGKCKIHNGIGCLVNDYGKDNLLYIVITYSNGISTAGAKRIASNNKRVREALKYHLNKLDLPYVVSIGIQSKTTHQHNLVPCFDFNIVLPHCDSSLLDNLVEGIYKYFRVIAKEPVFPDDFDNDSNTNCYNKPVRNANALANYLCQQTEGEHHENILSKLNSKHIFNQWEIISPDLKDRAKPQPTYSISSNLMDKGEFSEYVHSVAKLPDYEKNTRGGGQFMKYDHHHH